MRLNYSNYVQAYKRQAARMRKKGLEMKMELFDREEFRSIASALIEEHKDTLTDANKVYDKIVDRQAYGGMTLEKARAMNAAAKTLGIEGMTTQKMRELGMESEQYRMINDKIEAKAQEMRELGLSGAVIAQAIGVEFFGSPN